MTKIDRWKFPHAYHDEYLEGYNSSPSDECPYPTSKIGKYCAWVGGKFDRYGSTEGRKNDQHYREDLPVGSSGKGSR
ncbi:hypothetical protein ZC03_077 [Pseudomonas phage ZC03]|uniref:Uncharacterized protein n=2 Tax=Zicotriavirus TaxID=2843161 RepID=A0A1L2C971_9CAUD|nr:hypothetical protein HWA93_gp52 [Pseudomonas phage ZC03]YP_009830633.1 hypothetical protein HWA94_gp55 [Pseudomonas phage ZC08]AMD43454.1 hypothetical protein ZC03_077 [Pseudomonas phage ZC03]AMD43494.1 hypothetical protein ZC08_071 [Pseudomonas phage ZC08]